MTSQVLRELEATALALDAADPLAAFRDAFLIPRNEDGSEQTYFCGNSLGLQPRATRAALLDELDGYTRVLARLRAAIDAGDGAALEAVFTRSRAARKAWQERGAQPAAEPVKK